MGSKKYRKRFFSLEQLEYLDLGNTRLDKLPPDIGKLTSLTYLTLNHTKLTELPVEIKQLTNLQTLQLSGNLIFPGEEQQKIKQLLPWVDIDFPTYAQIAQIYYREKQYEDAVENWEKALQLEEVKLASVYREIVSSYLELKQYDRAISYMKRYLKLDSSNVYALDRLRDIYLERKHYIDAYAISQQLTSIDPQEVSYWIDQSYCAMLVRRPAEAILAAQKDIENGCTK